MEQVMKKGSFARMVRYSKLITQGAIVEILGYSETYNEYYVQELGSQCRYWHPAEDLEPLAEEKYENTKSDR